MPEHRFTHAERLDQLERLAAGLRALLAVLAAVPEQAGRVEEFRALLARCEGLRQEGFGAEALAELGRSVPDLWVRHKEWEPPVERDGAGRLRVTAEFVRLDEALQPVLRAAEELRTLGWY